MPYLILFHGSFEGLRTGSGSKHRGALLIDAGDLGQRAVRGAQDEATRLGYLELNLCHRCEEFFRYAVFLQTLRGNGLCWQERGRSLAPTLQETLGPFWTGVAPLTPLSVSTS